MADLKMFRMTQAIRPVAPGQIARFEKGKLAFHFLLRAAQPNPAAESHGSIIENTLASVRLNHGCGPGDACQRPAVPHQYWRRLQFKQILTAQRHKSPGNPLQSCEFQRVVR
jgi:hypothetical protein